MTVLVLLPGLDGTGRLFDAFATEMAVQHPGLEIIVASYPVDEPLDYDALEPQVRALLPQGQPFFLLGESFSGPLAIRLAATQPPGLQGLILSCSFASMPGFGWLSPMLPTVPLSFLPAPLLGYLTLGRMSSSPLLDDLLEILESVDPAVLRTRAQAAMSVDCSALLARVQVPLLYLQARNDHIVPESAGLLVRRLAPQSQLKVFDAPHLLLQSLPVDAAQTVCGFMAASLPGQARPMAGMAAC